MYKKVALLSLLFSFIIFGFDKLFLSKSASKIPDPEHHIRMVFEQLKNNDLKAFMKMSMSEADFKEMINAEFEKEKKLNPAIDKFISLPELEVLMGDYEEYYDTYLEDIEEYFEDTEKEIINWKNAKIEFIQWKITGNASFENQYLCNSKIVFSVNGKKYLIKYKNILYQNGKWFAGNLEDIDDLDFREWELDQFQNSLLFKLLRSLQDSHNHDYMPDMYREPAMEEYIDREESYPTEESSTEDEAMEED